MSTPSVKLVGFGYGERVEGTPPRSLGFSLLTPSAATPWAAEVEALARRLQETPYPEDWPVTDLFCSVLLAGGQRLVAVARYGLVDQTPGHRRGGLELFGVIAPAQLGIPSALAIDRWLRRRRGDTSDVRSLGGDFDLSDILATVPPEPIRRDSGPAVPILIWRDGVLLFTVTTPEEPDQRLGLLEQCHLSNWQWLPPVGADFPLTTHAQRGPLVAWGLQPTAGVASDQDRVSDAAGRRGLLIAVGLGAMCLLLAANLGATLWSRSPVEKVAPISLAAPEVVKAADRGDLDSFALALHGVLQRRQSAKEWSTPQLLTEYSRLTAEDDRLRVTSPDTKAALGAFGLLARGPAARVESIVREALDKKGYDPELIDLACRRVRERLAADGNDPR